MCYNYNFFQQHSSYVFSDIYLHVLLYTKHVIIGGGVLRKRGGKRGETYNLPIGPKRWVTLAKVLEGFTCSIFLSQFDGKINVRQYARKGHSTTDAFLYMLQAIYEAVDGGNAGARMFFADFSKSFDLIDHNILMDELIQREVSLALLSWIVGFLGDRLQAVKIGDKISNWLPLKGVIPQGTRLGVVLFTVMTNRLLS